MFTPILIGSSTFSDNALGINIDFRNKKLHHIYLRKCKWNKRKTEQAGETERERETEERRDRRKESENEGSRNTTKVDEPRRTAPVLQMAACALHMRKKEPVYCEYGKTNFQMNFECIYLSSDRLYYKDRCMEVSAWVQA